MNSIAAKTNIAARNRASVLGKNAMLMSMVVALIALMALLYTVVNGVFGYVIVRQATDPNSLSTEPLAQLSKDQLIQVMHDKAAADDVEGWTQGVLRRFDSEKPLADRTQGDLLQIVMDRIVKQETVESFTLTDSLFDRARIDRELVEIQKQKEAGQGDASLVFRSWIKPDFFTQPMNSVPDHAGVRTAVLGSLIVIVGTMLIAVPIGVGAAIYLEEYATRNRINQLIQTNINNLAGVPSIIYGMLGLFLFVRGLEALTSGGWFGIEGGNGRTVLSAVLTMALLVLPIIIINAQEAIRAVPLSLRQASYGIGATRWETIRDHVLPSALPGILTGTILAMSRAMGETAPLIVVGASTFIITDPTGPFSKFTVLPIQIYNWTAQPGEQYRNVAAAAILVLLVLLISLNLIAVTLRNRYGKSR